MGSDSPLPPRAAFSYHFIYCVSSTGPARAAWLTMDATRGSNSSSQETVVGSSQLQRAGPCCFLELIEVPSYMLQEGPGMRKRAMDLTQQPELLGWNHMALDVSEQIAKNQNNNDGFGRDPNDPKGGGNVGLSTYLARLNTTSVNRFGKTLRVAVEPKQQLIGNEVYELAFLYDADGCLIELLHKQAQLSQPIDSGWIPRDDLGFQGKS